MGNLDKERPMNYQKLVAYLVIAIAFSGIASADGPVYKKYSDETLGNRVAMAA